MKFGIFQVKVIFCMGFLSLISGCFDFSTTRPPLPDAETLYGSGKPFVRWWWFAGDIPEESITYQLDWLKEQGFGGVEIAWMYPQSKYDKEKAGTDSTQISWLSPEWSEKVRFAKSYAASVGLGCDFTFGTAWPFGDASVPRQDQVQIFRDTAFQQYSYRGWEYPRPLKVINHLDAGAFKRYAERMGKALEPALEEGAASLFCDSWEVRVKGAWKKGFETAFEERYGYDVRPFMEELYVSENAGPRYDYMRLLSENVLDGFYQPFSEECHELGALSRIQCASSPTDILSAFALADIPETEGLLFRPEYARIPASAALLSSKKIVSAESFTFLYELPPEEFGSEYTADMKLAADALFANGVNQIVWHGMPFNGKGESARFIAPVHVHPESDFAPQLQAFNAYLTRLSLLLRSGAPYTEMAVYLPIEDQWVKGEISEEKRFKPWNWGAHELRDLDFPKKLKGYHPSWINAEFLEQATFENGRLKVGDASFSWLYVDAEYLELKVVQSLQKLAEQGFRIHFEGRPEQPGHIPDEGYEGLLESLFGKASVTEGILPTDLQKPLVEGEELPPFYCRKSGEDLLFFFAHPLAKSLVYPQQKGFSYSSEKVSRSIKIHLANSSVTLGLNFAPHQSLLIRLSPEGEISFEDISFYPSVQVSAPL